MILETPPRSKSRVGEIILGVLELEAPRDSVHGLIRTTGYLPVSERWKASSPTPYTGPGRLQVIETEGATVMGGLEASK